MPALPISPGLPFMGKIKLGILARIPFQQSGDPSMHGWILPPAAGRDYPTFNQDPGAEDQAAPLIFYGTLDQFKLADVDGTPLVVRPIGGGQPSTQGNYVVIHGPTFGNFTATLANYGGGPPDGSYWFFTPDFTIGVRPLPIGAGVVFLMATYPGCLGYPALYGSLHIFLHTVTPGAAQIAANGGCPGADLAHVDLSGVEWPKVDLTGADLTGANLTGANLANAKLKRATLTGATLRGANLAGADFTGAVVTGLDLRSQGDQITDLRGTIFDGLDLTSVLFDPTPRFSTDPAHLTSFVNATLTFATIGKKWDRLNLTNARIVGLPTDLSNLSAVHADLTNIQLPQAVLKHAVLDQATLQGANLASSDLSFASLKGAIPDGDAGRNLAAAVLAAATLFDADLSGAQLSGADLSYVYLYGQNASVSGATMNLVNLAGAYLTGLDFQAIEDKQLQGTTFSGACLVNCRFQGTQLTNLDGKNASLTKACLQGANFADASLDGAVLVDAAVATGAGSLPVTLQIGGRPVKLSLTFDATTLPAGVTNGQTKCPNSQNGPCTADKLIAPKAPTQWPPANYQQERDAAVARALAPSRRPTEGQAPATPVGGESR